MGNSMDLHATSGPERLVPDSLSHAPLSRAGHTLEVDQELEAEYEEFVRTRQQALFGFALLLSGSHQDAQDLVQAALVKVYLKWARLHAGHNVDGYVRKIIVNEHASNWRRAWRRRERSAGGSGDLESVGVVDHEIADRDLAWRQVLRLPDRQRAVIALRFFEDRSVAETAEILGCTTGTVKSQTSKAIATLRGSIESQYREVD